MVSATRSHAAIRKPPRISPATTECSAISPHAAPSFKSAANATQDPTERAKYLDQAGLAYAQAGQRNRAEILFRAAIAAQPDNSAVYQDLIERVFAPAGNFAAAKALAAQGIARGAEPRALELALATAAEASGKLDDAEASMLQAIALRPAVTPP
jgi:tetratricopeptide (TPR) repeat protein